jgi:glycosyltransferase involved in cell wall biosynthesis
VSGLTLCVISFQEADRIGRCLDSVPFADEVLVVDSGSTDGTVEIARERGARVIQRDWPGHVAQKQFAVDQASHDRILSLDSDEWLSEKLAAEMEPMARADWSGAGGFEFPRLSRFHGRWMRHGVWYPDRQLRLFDRRQAHWGGRNPHDLVKTAAPVQRLNHPLLHDPYRTDAEYFATREWYTDLSARELHAEGRRAGSLAPLSHALGHLAKAFVINAGWLDGRAGLVLGWRSAGHSWMKYAKLNALCTGRAQSIGNNPRGQA